MEHFCLLYELKQNCKLSRPATGAPDCNVIRNHNVTSVEVLISVNADMTPLPLFSPALDIVGVTWYRIILRDQGLNLLGMGDL